MKTHPVLILTLGPLLSGCVGYNTTMFMTKSNVGLDFDSKPPTLEVSIARKEAVIAPAFEGGQTPPVMASFKPAGGTGSGFTSFFLGVDQTFAGGDAALAMSKLYDQPTATDKEKYDSAIKLNRAPNYRNPFQRVPGKGETRPLIFGTDTSLGLKAAWSGVGGQIPDTVKLGFNRKEFAWAPLSASPTNVNASGQAVGSAVAVKMPAFLATVESSQKLGTNGVTVQSMQYFATGDSATYLALQKDVRAAMLSRLDPNSEKFKARFGTQAQSVLSDTLFAVSTILSRFSAKGDAAAKSLLERLDALAGLEVPGKIGTAENPEYSFNDTNPNALLIEKNKSAETDLSRKKLREVTAYLNSLERSKTDLTRAYAEMAKGKTIKLQTAGAAPAAMTPEQQTELTEQLADLGSRLKKLKEALSSNRDVIAAYRYVESMVSPQ